MILCPDFSNNKIPVLDKDDTTNNNDMELVAKLDRVVENWKEHAASKLPENASKYVMYCIEYCGKIKTKEFGTYQQMNSYLRGRVAQILYQEYPHDFSDSFEDALMQAYADDYPDEYIDDAQMCTGYLREALKKMDVMDILNRFYDVAQDNMTWFVIESIDI